MICKACGNDFEQTTPGNIYCHDPGCRAERDNRRSRDCMRRKRGGIMLPRKTKQSEPVVYVQRFCECGTAVYGAHKFCSSCKRARKKHMAQIRNAAMVRKARGRCERLTERDVEDMT